MGDFLNSITKLLSGNRDIEIEFLKLLGKGEKPFGLEGFSLPNGTIVPIEDKEATAEKSCSRLRGFC